MILHCFLAPWRVQDATERGWYCSFAGNVTYPRAEELREAAAKVPDELLLVETDAPYLAPSRCGESPTSRPTSSPRREAVAAVRGVSLRGAGADVEANARAPLRLVAGRQWSGSGQNFLADPNLLDAIVRDAELDPADVVLEVGAGEGVLTERLAGGRRPRPRDRARPRPGAGAGRGRRRGRTSICTGATR